MKMKNKTLQFIEGDFIKNASLQIVYDKIEVDNNER